MFTNKYRRDNFATNLDTYIFDLERKAQINIIDLA